jgi:simple sugar transport system ATP-binding protein/ribose transport system ATP-binding protein
MTAETTAPGTARPIVELVGAQKRFGGELALHDVDVAVRAGEIHALVGENGAGKSTLVKVLMGVHRLDAGRLLVDGQERAYRSPHDALADGIAGIEQEISLVPDQSVMENVFLGREPRHFGVIARRALRARFRELRDRTGFDIPADARVASLALVDRQSVEIMRALGRDARVIVMDEPTAALTRTEAEKLFSVARRLRDAGTAVIYISHFLDEVLALADRVTVLRDGRCVRTTTAEGETADSLVTSMLGRSLGQVFPPRRPLEDDAPVRLSVRDLSRDTAFRDVSLDVRAGEIIGLAGLVGAGRTELARAIVGAEPPTAGTVTMDGALLRITSPRDAIAHGIAYLTESRKDDGLMLGRGSVENVTLPHLALVSRWGVVRRRAERAQATELLQRLQVTARTPNAAVQTLSGGNQQKVLFARWMFARPKVLIVDEPTRGVDIGAKTAIYDLIREVANEGIAVLVISSEHEELIGLADRVHVMRGGRVAATLEGGDLNEDNILSAAMTD